MILTSNNKEIKVSSEFFEIAQKYKWVSRKGFNKDYVFTYISGRKKSFGHIVFGLKKGQFIFHKNGNTFDYTNENIIICDRSKLGHYISIFRKNNIPGSHGVFKIGDRYGVKICKGGCEYTGGIFEDKKDAAVIADCISIEVYGKDSLRNLPELSCDELLKMKAEILVF